MLAAGPFLHTSAGSQRDTSSVRASPLLQYSSLSAESAKCSFSPWACKHSHEQPPIYFRGGYNVASVREGVTKSRGVPRQKGLCSEDYKQLIGRYDSEGKIIANNDWHMVRLHPIQTVIGKLCVRRNSVLRPKPSLTLEGWISLLRPIHELRIWNFRALTQAESPTFGKTRTGCGWNFQSLRLFFGLTSHKPRYLGSNFLGSCLDVGGDFSSSR